MIGETSGGQKPGNFKKPGFYAFSSATRLIKESQGWEVHFLALEKQINIAGNRW